MEWEAWWTLVGSEDEAGKERKRERDIIVQQLVGKKHTHTYNLRVHLSQKAGSGTGGSGLSGKRPIEILAGRSGAARY